MWRGIIAKSILNSRKLNFSSKRALNSKICQSLGDYVGMRGCYRFSLQLEERFAENLNFISRWEDLMNI